MTSASTLLPLATQTRLRWLDYLLLAAFCFLLFGLGSFVGQPVTLHEARLPQCSREMLQTGDWLMPRSGGRVWPERPPLPHWLTIAVSLLFGQHCDSVWVVRLPAIFSGLATVLLTAWIAARLMGRNFALLTAFILATGFEFYRYSTLAEDDIFLAALLAAAMACFVAAEFPPPGEVEQKRRLPILGFFVLLGLANMVKSPLIGDIVIFGSIGAFLLWNRDRKQILGYLSPLGILLWLILLLAWPVIVCRLYPEARILDNWLFDYRQTHDYDQPFWYYFPEIFGRIVPWSPAALMGLFLLLKPARSKPNSPERLMLCWAIVPLIVLSLPTRKHHHYLVPSLAPWALVAAFGLRQIWQWVLAIPKWMRHPAAGLCITGTLGVIAILIARPRIPGSHYGPFLLSAAWLASIAILYLGLHRQRPALAFAGLLALITSALTYFIIATIPQTESYADTLFLERANLGTGAGAPADRPLFVNANLDSMDFFRIQFYLKRPTTLLHNLTFLRDQGITAGDVYLITRASDEPFLKTLGSVQVVDQSARTRGEKKDSPQPAIRFTLFHLIYAPEVPRYLAPPISSITAKQAMEREPGPFCGPPLPPLTPPN